MLPASDVSNRHPVAVKYPSVVPLARSPAFLLAIGLVHLMPLASVLGAGVPPWVLSLVVPLCALSLGRECLTAARLKSASLRPHSGGAQLVSSGRAAEGRVLPDSVDMGPLIVLHWQPEGDGKARRFALVSDAFTAEDWRVLKIWLRWSVMKQA